MISEFRKFDQKRKTKAIVLVSLLIFLVVNVLLIFAFLFNFKNNIITETSINVHEYEEFDASHICQMFGCDYIQNNNILYKNISNNKLVRLEKTNDEIYKRLEILENVYLTSDFNILVTMELTTVKNNFIVVSKTRVFDIINNVYYYLLMFTITLSLNLFVFITLYYRKFQHKQSLLLQHESYYKSMMQITENIHHELNTPLAVINSKVEKLKNIIIDINEGKRNRETCDIDSSMKDFDVVSASLIQISDLLNRMRPFKDAKHQANRDLKTILRTACDMSLVTQHERFDYEISSDFSNYKVNSEYIKNGEMTAIILNFIKNSVEANACFLSFKIKEFKNNKLSFFIIDDGNGIPENMKANIFKEHVSSKSSSRGTGLFGNKFIITNSNGDIKLSHTSSKGTIFEVTIEAIEVK